MTDDTEIPRRKFVYSASAVALSAGIAGCGTGTDSGGGDDDGSGGSGGSSGGSGGSSGGSGGSSGGGSQEGVPDEIPVQWWAPFEEEYFSDTDVVEKTPQELDDHGPTHTAVRGQPLDPITEAFAHDEEPWMREHALMIQRSFTDLGVPVELVSMPLNSLYDDNWRDDIGLSTVVSMNTHGPDPQRGLDPHPYQGRMHASNPSNSMNYWNDQVHELLEQSITQVSDRQKRIEAVHELQDVGSRDMYINTTGFADIITAMNTDRFTGYVGTPGNGHTRDSFVWTNVNVQPQTDKTTFVKGVTASANSLNIGYGTGGPGVKRLTNVYDGLFDASPQLEIVPALATGREAVDDTTVDVELREGVTWHDGESFGPDDVKFTVDMFIETNTTEMNTFVDPVESVEVLSNSGGGSVRFNLSRPDAGFLTFRLVRGVIFPKHIWENVDNPNQHSPDPPIGTGPFQFENWEQGTRMELSKWEDHWMWDDDIRRELVGEEWFEPGDGIDSLVWANVANTDALLGALQEGSIDAIAVSLSNSQAERVAQASGIEKRTARNYGALDVHINHQVPLIRDKEFRQAWGHAVDKEGFIEGVLEGRGTVQPTGGNNIAPILGNWYNEEAYQYEYDVELARTRLEKAGYTWNDDGTLVWPDGEAWAAFHERIQQENTSKTREELGQPDFS